LTKKMSLSEKQNEFLKALQSKKYRYLMFGGGMAGGKSILQIGILHELAMAYPNTRYAVIRKTYSILKRTSWKTFQKITEINQDKGLDINNSDLIIKYPNGSEVLFLEADRGRDPDLNKLKGLELTGALCEEANELDEDVFNILKLRIGRWNNGEKIPAFIMLNCNPANNWVKKYFYEPSVECTIKEPYYFLQALATDNPFLDNTYLDGLKDLPEAQYQRYVMGNWEYGDDPDNLIQYSWLRDCLSENNGIIKYLGVDVARYGNDKTILCYASDSGIVAYDVIDKQDTAYVANYVLLKAKEHNIKSTDIAIDTIGLGAGVFDNLKEKKMHCLEFIASQAPSESQSFFKFKNLRAEAGWQLREDIRQGVVSLPNHKPFENEAVAIKYKVTDKVISIEAKEEIKKRLGFSPDYYDATVMANALRARIPFAQRPLDLSKISLGSGLLNIFDN
jgi:phage terminase large subunit